MESSSGAPTTKKHSRSTSGRGSMPRRSTRGPLEISQSPVALPIATSPAHSQTASPRTPSIPSSSPSNTPMVSLKSFPSLLRPEIFHPLTALTVAPPFRASSYQANSTTSIHSLLQTGHFRAAAIASATALTAPGLSPSDHVTIFSLFYVRLAALTLCGSTALAAQEATALEDLNSSIYRDDVSGAHLAPWELRVLAVRLQATGFNDPRKGIMGHYDLAREARSTLLKLSLDDINDGDTEKERELWESRLKDLGIRVGNALVEMEDLEGAARHLASLDADERDYLSLQRALLWFKIGNLEAASRCVGEERGLVEALGCMADGEYRDAVRAWTALCEEDEANAMYKQNLAVCLLYAGHMDEARSVLERLMDQGQVFYTVTFNLSTIYELCTDRSQAAKLELAERAAKIDPAKQDGLGWEKGLLDFKL